MKIQSFREQGKRKITYCYYYNY